MPGDRPVVLGHIKNLLPLEHFQCAGLGTISYHSSDDIN